MKTYLRQVILAAALVLSACDNASLNEQQVAACVTIHGGGTQVVADPQVFCAGCSASASDNAIDGDKDTSSSLLFDPDGTGTITLRLQAQDGVVFPAGAQAGVVVAIPEGSSKPYVGIYVDTYLDGVRQDRLYGGPDFAAGTQTSNGMLGTGCYGRCDPSRRLVTGSAPSAFDAIEVGFARDESGIEQDIRVYEFCSNLDY
jgi:hypothetical protein